MKLLYAHVDGFNRGLLIEQHHNYELFHNLTVFKIRIDNLVNENAGIFDEWVKHYQNTKTRKQKAITYEIMCYLLTWEQDVDLLFISTNKIITDLKNVLFKLFLRVKRAALKK